MRTSLAASCRVSLVFAALLFALNAPAAVLAVHTFDADAEGWTGLSCPNPGLCAAGTAPLTVQFLATGGNPGGYIRTVDPSSSAAGRVAPPAAFSALLGIGQTLSFDARVERNGGNGVFDAATAPLVTIETASGTLVFGTSDFPIIDGAWKHYDVPLEQTAAWRIFDGTLRTLGAGEFASAFATRSRLTIISEWLKDGGDVDTGGLDNIRLSAVPVPAALPLLLSALGVLGYRRRQP